jgi:hypothetical protein
MRAADRRLLLGDGPYTDASNPALSESRVLCRRDGAGTGGCREFSTDAFRTRSITISGMGPTTRWMAAHRVTVV